MNRVSNHHFSDSVSSQNEQLDFELIGSIEKQCRQQRSEAIYQVFAWLMAGIVSLPKTLADIASADSRYLGAKDISDSFVYKRLNLHTE